MSRFEAGSPARAPVVAALLCWIGWVGVITLYPAELPFPPDLTGPLDLTGGPETGIPRRWASGELVLNLALFLPVGYLAGRLWRQRPGLTSVGLVVVLAGTTETVQHFLPGRDPSALDVLLNVAGAGIGGVLSARPLPRRAHPIWAFGLLSWLGVVAAVIDHNTGAMRLHDWTTSYGFALGAEVTGDRSFAGDVHEAYFCARAENGDQCIEVEEGLQPGRPIVEAVLRSQSFSIGAVATSRSRTQTGPARIVTWSADASRRNLTLGQEGRDAVLRVRSAHSTENGTWPSLRFPGALADVALDTPFEVVAHWAGGVARLTVNQRGRSLYSEGVRLTSVELIGLQGTRREFLTPGRESSRSMLAAAFVIGVPAGTLAVVAAAAGPVAWTTVLVAGAVLAAVPPAITGNTDLVRTWLLSVLGSVFVGAAAAHGLLRDFADRGRLRSGRTPKDRRARGKE